MLDNGYPLTGSERDSFGERVYLDDPDGNGLELYHDHPRERWIDEDGKLILSRPQQLDPESLLDELDPA